MKVELEVDIISFYFSIFFLFLEDTRRCLCVYFFNGINFIDNYSMQNIIRKGLSFFNEKFNLNFLKYIYERQESKFWKIKTIFENKFFNLNWRVKSIIDVKIYTMNFIRRTKCNNLHKKKKKRKMNYFKLLLFIPAILTPKF